MQKSIIFLSHIHEDKSIAIALAEHLERAFSRAVDVFVSSDGASILLGDKWLDRIEENLKKATIVIVLASPDSVSRPWINFEAGGGWLRGARVMPVCIRGMEIAALPQPLKTLQACQISSAGGVKAFFEGVGRVLDLDCSLSNWDEVQGKLFDVETPGVAAGFSMPAAMPETWAIDNSNYAWVSDLGSPELLEIATSLLAVRQACHEKLLYREKNPESTWSANQTECRMYSKAVEKLR
jgi:hypothetical protein